MKSSRKLNQGQLDVLELLYKFRFGTATLLAKTLNLKDRTFINSRLKILTKHGYLARNFERNFPVKGKSASYCLLPKAFVVLKEHEVANPKVLKNIYKDPAASEGFINRCLAIFAAYCHFKAVYGDDLEFFTKSDMASYDYFPAPLPDAFIRYKDKGKSKSRARHFFLELCDEATPFFVIVRRIRQYIDYADSGDWDVVGGKLPAILFICDTITLQKRLRKRLLAIADDSEGLQFYTTTKELFFDSNQAENDIWQPIYKTTKLISLSAL